MKIEKLSENQIRCTLNKSDLASRQLKISELAYGSEKAKELFRDMMQQASYELGFEADDIPIMIEAIPVSADCIVLIVTKVDDPEELDTRFSKFTPSSDFESTDSDSSYGDYNSLQSLQNLNQNQDIPTAKDELKNTSELKSDHELTNDSLHLTNDVMNLFSKVKDYLNSSIEDQNRSTDLNNKISPDIKDDKSKSSKTSEISNSSSSTESISTKSDKYTPVTDDDSDTKKDSTFVPLKETLKGSKSSESKIKKNINSPKQSQIEQTTEKIIRIFSFPSFDYFCEAAKAVTSVYADRNSLYKDKIHARYFLTLEKNVCNAINFNKTCNILSEYGTKEALNKNSVNYFDEHLEVIIKNKAIQIAARL